MKAANAGDVEGLVALYAPDAVLYAPDSMEARGTAAIRALYTAMFAANTVSNASINFNLSDLRRSLHGLGNRDPDDDAQGRRRAADRRPSA